MEPRVENVKRHTGVAGQYSYTADVTIEGEGTERYEFVSSSYGGPVVMVTPSGAQAFVTNPGRFGAELDGNWLRRFFA